VVEDGGPEGPAFGVAMFGVAVFGVAVTFAVELGEDATVLVPEHATIAVVMQLERQTSASRFMRTHHVVVEIAPGGQRMTRCPPGRLTACT
jgi:hypothetical protein